MTPYKLVYALVYAVGDEADDIMAGFGLTAEERERAEYSVVKEKFDSHSVVHRNAIFERAKFNRVPRPLTRKLTSSATTDPKAYEFPVTTDPKAYEFRDH